MRPLILIISLGIYLTTSAQGYNINITVKGIEDSTAVIGYYYGNQRLLLDTLSFDKNRNLLLAGQDSLSVGVYFVYTPSFYFEFIVKEQEFDLNIDKIEGYGEMEVNGSLENVIYRDFQNNMGDIQRTQNKLYASLDTISGDDSLMVMEEITNLRIKANDYRNKLLQENKGTFSTSFIDLMEEIKVPDFENIEDINERRGMQFRYYKDHYFDRANNAKDLMLTPVFHNYVMKYFDQLVLPQADSVNKEIDSWLNRFADDSRGFRYWLVTLSSKYQQSNIMGMDGVTVHLADNYFLTDKVDWMTDVAKEEIRKELRFIRPNLIGKQMSPLNLVDTALQTFSFQSLKEDYLVLFFYDPDCGICKQKTPILKAAYEEIKNFGGQVVAICTISDIEKWKNYIKENDLDWVNLGDPYGRSDFRLNYNVRSTPQVYILDPSRKIVAKKIDVEKVTDFIKNYSLLMEEISKNE